MSRPPETPAQILARTLPALLRERQITQTEVAELAGLTMPQISLLCRGRGGRGEVYAGTLIRLADAIGCSVDRLLDRENPA